MREIDYTMPLLPMRGISVFPGMVLHFDVARPRSIAAVKKAMDTDKLIFLCNQNDISSSDADPDDLAEVGTIAEIHQILNLPDGNLRVLVEGVDRAKLLNHNDEGHYTSAGIISLNNIDETPETRVQVLMRRTLHLVEEFNDIYDRIPPEIITALLAVDDPGELADIVAAHFPLKPQSKQIILGELDVAVRLEKLNRILSDELEILTLEHSIMDKVQTNMDKNQRDYMLHEKLKVIHEELGDMDEADADISRITKKLEGMNLPLEVSEKLNEEFERMRRTSPISQEYGIILNYVETVASLPWNVFTTDCTDMDNAAAVLEKEHYGLKKVKERILEYVAVKSLGGKPKSNIICLVGPPGTGKTSIAVSLAKALGRKYVRISLGGVRNEAEIRGHRKTYLGAMPGRIIDALKRSGSANPLILFDEIDKMTSDSLGDPASALLEVLDPEQNKSFRDHFLELPFDLSQAIFVMTANTLETIPAPLLDRMDVIEVEGYTVDEKIQIAKKYLLPKQRRLHGLNGTQLRLAPSAYSSLIDGYTRESGVRELERKLAAICRKTAVKIARGDDTAVSVKAGNLKEILGRKIYISEKNDDKDKVGIVTGLAWTSVGGDTLSIEVNTMPGSGKLELTGNLGDVMKESAKAALSYVRSNSQKLGINTDFYKNTDIHIHIPEGAVPKDGPSAGITMTTAIISALSGRKVKHEIAMTGEVTLRGRVLPIGGLKEKTLAAYRFGIKKIIIPYENKPDYDELPDVVKNNITFVFAKDMDTVADTALYPALSGKKPIIHTQPKYMEKTDLAIQEIRSTNLN
ncbi:MAG: endopeptidase La [Clostridiales bacterium]|nr:endopeptidase La [Clostridiales bacterium]